jgi:hypothetical protein
VASREEEFPAITNAAEEREKERARREEEQRVREAKQRKEEEKRAHKARVREQEEERERRARAGNTDDVEAGNSDQVEAGNTDTDETTVLAPARQHAQQAATRAVLAGKLVRPGAVPGDEAGTAEQGLTGTGSPAQEQSPTERQPAARAQVDELPRTAPAVATRAQPDPSASSPQPRDAGEEEDDECCVCMDAPNVATLIPCQHMVVCEGCANKGNECERERESKRERERESCIRKQGPYEGERVRAERVRVRAMQVVRVCVWVSVRVCVYGSAGECVSFTCTYSDIYVYMYLCVYVCMYVCMYVSRALAHIQYLCMHACMHACMYV